MSGVSHTNFMFGGLGNHTKFHPYIIKNGMRNKKPDRCLRFE